MAVVEIFLGMKTLFKGILQKPHGPETIASKTARSAARKTAGKIK
jgi:hypothetical protein